MEFLSSVLYVLVSKIVIPGVMSSSVRPSRRTGANEDPGSRLWLMNDLKYILCYNHVTASRSIALAVTC